MDADRRDRNAARLSRRQFLAASSTLLAAAGAGATVADAANKVRASTPTDKQGDAPLDVLVLGAGLSGLNAALLLEEQGARVRVLEARQRIGGRLYSRFDLPGYPEVGGNTVAAGYGRILDMARRLNVPMDDCTTRLMLSATQSIAIGDLLMDRRQWAASKLNSQPEGSREQFPSEYVARQLSAANPLKSSAGWTDPANKLLDRPLHEVLRERGLTAEQIRLGFDRNVPYGNSAYDLSALMYWFIDRWNGEQIASAKIARAARGGNQKLPIAMAAALKSEVRLGSEVVAITDNGQLVEARCRDGSVHRARHLVCALPFSVLREISFDPLLPGAQAKAIQTLPYMKITHQFFVPKRAYWKEDGISPSFWTDGPAGVISGQRFGATDDEITIVVASQRGHTADAMDRLGADAAKALALREIERLRPAAKGALEPVAFHSWGLDPFNAGDWALFAPGQVQEFVGELGRAQGRLHFCGEHTAIANRGMEGAMESGERAALEVATLL